MATAFAIFCADDGSLTFYKRDTIPAVGDEFEGKVVGAVYEGFESEVNIYNSAEDVPWYNEMADIVSVSFVDEISPVYTTNWFYEASNMTSFDAINLNTNNVIDMMFMFAGCSGLTTLDLSGFDISNVVNTMFMFAGCSNLTTIYVSNLWSTNNVTSSDYMFVECTSLVGAIPFDSTVTNATHANYQTGYLTYKFYADYLKNRFVIDGADLNRLADAIRDKTGTLAGLSFPDGFIAAIESISVVATDDENGNVVMSIAGLSSTNSNGDVVIK